jgi:hypothetical protein
LRTLAQRGIEVSREARPLLGDQVRPNDRGQPAPGPIDADDSMASGRNGLKDRRSAHVALAGRRCRRRSPERSGSGAPQQGCGVELMIWDHRRQPVPDERLRAKFRPDSLVDDRCRRQIARARPSRSALSRSHSGHPSISHRAAAMCPTATSRSPSEM